MADKTLSVFIDESGDFGPYEPHAPYYLVSMILHDQSISFSKDIANFDKHLNYLGYPYHAIHTGPLIRRESIYSHDPTTERKRLFHALFHFARKLNFHYICIKIKKSEYPDSLSMSSRLSHELTNILKQNEHLWNQFQQVIIYYDNGQIELSKILTSAFNLLYTHVDFRKVKPIDYKLFQIADLICTLELLAEKTQTHSFSNSEKIFFGNIRDFKKNYLKPIRKKRL